jgi:hypothetical protein
MYFPSLYALPLYASLVCFPLREAGGFCKRKERGREGGRGRRRERRESENKLTYLLCFLKKEEEGERVCERINRLTFYVF